MSGVGAVVDAVFGSYDLKNAKQWRDEDLQFREQEKQWREDTISRELAWRQDDLERRRRVLKLENEKRAIDARHKQLSALSQLTAMIGGFSMVSLVEINLPEDLNEFLLFIYGAIVCLQFICMLLCMLMCTLLLLAVTRYVTHKLEAEVLSLSSIELDLHSPFAHFWMKTCENEWLGWVVFGQSLAAAICITILSAVAMLYFYLHISSRWRYLVKPPKLHSINRTDSVFENAP